MSRRAFERIVRSYEEWDPDAMWSDVVCLDEVSKVLRGQLEIRRRDEQQCEDLRCRTLKLRGQSRMEIRSYECDSELSQKLLDGTAEGEFVSAYVDADGTRRGGMSSNLKWAGAGATVVGRSMASLNAGTHHEPLDACEPCHKPYHLEGWLRAAIVEGDCTGARVTGSVAYDFEQIEAFEEGEIWGFRGVFEGMIIRQCHPD